MKKSVTVSGILGVVTLLAGERIYHNRQVSASTQAATPMAHLHFSSQVNENKSKIMVIEKELHYIKKGQDRNFKKLDDIGRLLYDLRELNRK